MTNTKFGFGQLGNANPDWATWISKLYFLLGASGMGMMTALGIPPNMEQRIATIALAFSPLFILLGEMFGVNLEGNVPADKVTGVKTNDEPAINLSSMEQSNEKA
jgi:hypothetical protein